MPPNAAVRSLHEVLIWGRDPIKAERRAFEARAAGHRCTAAESLDEAVRRADIISTATLATTPLIKGSLLRPGTHLDLVGAFRPEMCEADAEAFSRARVFVDTLEGALHEAGDLLQAIETGALAFADIEADIAALCNESHPGRGQDANAITLFKSVGSSLEDLTGARVVFAAWMRERVEE